MIGGHEKDHNENDRKRMCHEPRMAKVGQGQEEGQEQGQGQTTNKMSRGKKHAGDSLLTLLCPPPAVAKR